MKIIQFFSLLSICLIQLLMSPSFAQTGFSFEIAKPKNYETRKLPSEKTGDRKFTAPKRFFTNLVSRFNYYYNAENTLEAALTAAKTAHQDDYSKLLSFYNYQIDESAKQPMDSVIYKCTAGILLHDLRSDWVDKLYLLMGQAYLYRKDYDSAKTVFQYINYAFAPKDNGYDIPIGSNASNTNGVFTIATKENRNLWKRMTSFPPSRNEAFLWQVRTLVEQNQLIEATSLLELLKPDPNFPERLRPLFNELMAYAHYKQGYYEKAADALILSIQTSDKPSDRARKNFLAGQLYQQAHQSNKSVQAFQQSIKHSVDPVMEVFARMNLVELSNASQENALQKNLDELLGMAKKDKYTQYREIIYFAAAQLALKAHNPIKAEQLLLSSIQFCQDNEKQKNQNFLQLGNMAYAEKQYGKANQYFDSIHLNMLSAEEAQKLSEIKPAIAIIAANQYTIQREDSLQGLGKLTASQLEAEIKRILKQIKKEKGIKESASDQNNANSNDLQNNFNLFGNKSNDFYFSNASLKARGANDFNIKWGNRPNIDNWRRQAAVNGSLMAGNPNSLQGNAKNGSVQKDQTSELSFESLLNQIPISPIEIENSQKAILKSMMENGETFQNQLADYPKAIEIYEELRKRFPEGSEAETALKQLYFCYQKINAQEKANEVFETIKNSYPNSEFAQQLMQAKNQPNVVPVNKATIAYQEVYNLFIAGNFEAAKKAKINADNQFGKHYWTPQLLYIEAIYYIKQREDSTAINRLQNIQSLFANSLLANKAKTMIQVLRNRDSIENYLSNLQLTDTESYATRGILLDENKPVLASTVTKKEGSIQTPSQLKPLQKDLADITNKKTIGSNSPRLKKDSFQTSPPKVLPTSSQLNNAVLVAQPNSKTYQFNLADTQYVTVILNKVDPIFISEARNAFNRFNTEFYHNKPIDIAARKINDQYQFIMIGPFDNAGAAFEYIDRAKPQAKPRIIPWLATDKYSFNMISNFNMNLLINTQDLAGYLTFIHKLFPDKF